jgi:hypothetical protein
MEGGRWQAFFIIRLSTLELSDCSTGSSATQGEVILCSRKAENAPSVLAECEGITRNIAVLEQDSGNSFCHDAVPQLSLVGCHKKAKGFPCLSSDPEKSKAAEETGKKKKKLKIGLFLMKSNYKLKECFRNTREKEDTYKLN